MSRYRNKTTFSSFRFAIRGIILAIKSQRNIRSAFLISFAVVLAALIFRFSSIELALIVMAIGFVIFAEFTNTIIEFVVDTYFKNKYSEIAGMSKDIAAGTVLISVIIAAIIGGLLFLPKIYVFVNNYFFNVNPLVL